MLCMQLILSDGPQNEKRQPLVPTMENNLPFERYFSCELMLLSLLHKFAMGTSDNETGIIDIWCSHCADDCWKISHVR